MKTDTSIRTTETNKENILIGESKPFFRFDKERDPFYISDKKIECPFHYLIDIDTEEKQLYYQVVEVRPEGAETLYLENIRDEERAKTILSTRSNLYKLLVASLRDYKLEEGIKDIASLMVVKLYKDILKIFLAGEVERRLDEIKQEQRYQKRKDLQSKVNPEILEEIRKNPIQAINKACECVGIIRETKNKIALYLSGILGKDAGMVFIAGNTSTGKSHLMNNVLKLYPDDYVFDVSSFSDKAPLYLYDAHKEMLEQAEIWCVHETIQQSSAFRDFLMRMITNPEDKEFTYQTVDKNKHGQNTVRILTLPKVSVWTSLTLGDINPENLNRGISVSVEESEDKTKDILEYEAGFDAIGGKPDFTEHLESFKAWSNELIEKRREIEGWICPFFHTNILQMPTNKPSIIRHLKRVKLYSLGFAIMNNRPIIEKEKRKLILIEPADILLALELFRDILTETMSEIDRRHMKTYEKAVEDIQESVEGYTTIKRIHERIKTLSQVTIRLYLRTLCKKNFLTYEKSREDKKTYQYYLTENIFSSTIELDQSKIKDIWKENFTKLPAEIQTKIEENYPEYRDGSIFLEHTEDLYFLSKKITDTVHKYKYRMYGENSRKRQLKLDETTKQKVNKDRTQNKYNNLPKEQESILRKILETCKELEEKNKGDYSPKDVIETICLQDKQISEKNLFLAIEKLIELGYLFEHVANKLKTVRG